MTFAPSSLASVRSYYFREALADPGRTHITGRYATLADYRPYWQDANVKAHAWMRMASNRYNHATRTWSNPQ